MSDALVVSPAARGRGLGRLSTLGGVCLLILGWELAGRALAGSYVLAPPSAVALYLWEHAGLMARAFSETLGNAALGFLLGNGVAMALAALALLWPASERVLAGLALVVFCLPLVATGPILRVLMGPGNGPQVTLAALAVYYTTLVPLLVGLRAAPASWFDLVRSYGRGRGAELVHVRAMAALPYLFAGLQIAAPAAFLGAMVGEFTGAERGVGVLSIRAMRDLDAPATWALATLASGVAILAYAGIGWLGRVLLSAPPPVLLAPPRPVGRGGRAGLVQALVVVALALLLWWGLMEALSLNRFFAKRPADVFAALVTAPSAGQTRATLFAAMTETLILLVPGYLAGLAAGFGLAVVLVLVPALASVAMPVAIALRSVPIVTTAPLFVLFLGRGASGTIVLVAVMVFFPTYVACAHGLRRAPGQISEVFDSYAATRLHRLVHLRIPAMLPAFFAAARMSVPAAVLAVTVVEWLATGIGVGSLMALSASLSNYTMLWSAVVMVTLMSVLFYLVVSWLERRVLAVYAPEQGHG